jgi:hypothetical protein
VSEAAKKGGRSSRYSPGATRIDEERERVWSFDKLRMTEFFYRECPEGRDLPPPASLGIRGFSDVEASSPGIAAAPGPAHATEPHHHEKRRVALAAGLALLWCIFTLLAQFSGALEAFEEPLLDWRQALHSYPVPSITRWACAH